jgi:hypothetical protein
VAGFSDDNPMIAPFTGAHPLIERQLKGKKQALEALGVYHLVADSRIPGQLASETKLRNQRVQLVRSQFIADHPERNAWMGLIVKLEKDGTRQRELFMGLVWALAVIRGRIETAAARIEGEQIYADLGRNRRRLEHGLDAIVRATRLIVGSASEFHAQRRDGILPLLPSVGVSDDVDQLKALLEAVTEQRFYPALYGTDGHVGADPMARFNDVFQAGVGDFAAIAEGLLGVKRNDRIARLATLGFNGIPRPGSAKGWDGTVHDEQVIRWRERAVLNRKTGVKTTGLGNPPLTNP